MKSKRARQGQLVRSAPPRSPASSVRTGGSLVRRARDSVPGFTDLPCELPLASRDHGSAVGPPVARADSSGLGGLVDVVVPDVEIQQCAALGSHRSDAVFHPGGDVDVCPRTHALPESLRFALEDPNVVMRATVDVASDLVARFEAENAAIRIT